MNEFLIWLDSWHGVEIIALAIAGIWLFIMYSWFCHERGYKSAEKKAQLEWDENWKMIQSDMFDIIYNWNSEQKMSNAQRLVQLDKYFNLNEIRYDKVIRRKQRKANEKK